MKVENMTSSSGNKVANQFIIHTDSDGVYFQSYRIIICHQCIREGNWITELDRELWDYSKTTSKYRNLFLGETTAETQKKINSGEYILTDLN